MKKTILFTAIVVSILTFSNLAFAYRTGVCQANPRQCLIGILQWLQNNN